MNPLNIINSVASDSPSDVSAPVVAGHPPVSAIAGAVDFFSDGALVRSLPSGEIEPSVTSASAPSESSSGDGLGNLEPGSITSGDRFAVTAGSGRARNRAICPAVTGFNSNPDASSHPPASVNCGAVSPPAAAPLSLSSNTPEASGTARKAPCGSLLGEPSRISDRASLSLPLNFDAEVSALELAWRLQKISAVTLPKSEVMTSVAPGMTLQSDGLGCACIKNSTSFAIRAFDAMSANLIQASASSFDPSIPST
jgi:hypothetical protein